MFHLSATEGVGYPAMLCGVGAGDLNIEGPNRAG